MTGQVIYNQRYRQDRSLLLSYTICTRILPCNGQNVVLTASCKVSR